MKFFIRADNQLLALILNEGHNMETWKYPVDRNGTRALQTQFNYKSVREREEDLQLRMVLVRFKLNFLKRVKREN